MEVQRPRTTIHAVPFWVGLLGPCMGRWIMPVPGCHGKCSRDEKGVPGCHGKCSRDEKGVPGSHANWMQNREVVLEDVIF